MGLGFVGLALAGPEPEAPQTDAAGRAGGRRRAAVPGAPDDRRPPAPGRRRRGAADGRGTARSPPRGPGVCPVQVTSPLRSAFRRRSSSRSMPRVSASSSIRLSTANSTWGTPKPRMAPPIGTVGEHHAARHEDVGDDVRTAHVRERPGHHALAEGGVGTGVREDVHLESGQAAVGARGQTGLDLEPVPLGRREVGLFARVDQLDRAPQLQRGRAQHSLHRDVELAPEGAPGGRLDDAQLVGRHAERLGQRLVVLVDVLAARRDDQHAVVVDEGRAGIGLQVGVLDGAGREPAGDAHLGRRQRGGSVTPHHLQQREQVGAVVVELRRALGEGRVRVEDGRAGARTPRPPHSAAAAACASVSATTTATGSPTYRTFSSHRTGVSARLIFNRLVPATSAAVSTATTPGSASAAAASTPSSTACACGLRTTLRCRTPDGVGVGRVDLGAGRLGQRIAPRDAAPDERLARGRLRGGQLGFAPQHRGRQFDGGDDLHVAGAPTQVGLEGG